MTSHTCYIVHPLLPALCTVHAFSRPLLACALAKISVRMQSIMCEQSGINEQVKLKVLEGFDCLEASGEDSEHQLTDANFLTFSTMTKNLSNLALCISIFTPGHTSTDPTLVGKGYVTAAYLTGSIGRITTTINNSTGFPIGHVKVGYVLVRAWSLPEGASYHPSESIEKSMSGPFLCGHRGAGESFNTTTPSEFPENTIAAFKAAKSLGVHFVEFDVHVTKDHVPVVFHDDTVKLSVETSNQKFAIDFEIPVKDLTFQQTRHVKVWQRSVVLDDPENDSVIDGFTDKVVAEKALFKDPLKRHHEKSLFPTLKEAFLEVSSETGFFIEVKYPMETTVSGNVDHLCTDGNILVDSILNVVFENAGSRKVFFICFDPNICTMLKLKQNRFPVMFLSSCENDLWVPYKDMRTRNIASAVAFAKSLGLDGLSLFSTALMQAPADIDRVKKEGLTLSTWGHENNQAEKRQWQHEKGIRYITLDRVCDLLS
ncbi:glycerophosphocholine phosphodiesterase GPCPD1 isoform X2 [Nematostella vectensis]|uniref:glycerophosphocholine phosphodiesterase GPCPD1 isoform X2 n=1 Tax=Nematostella vectensis TaxID=45351 RepID=UPI0020779A09|nr:glycerophosphocholine phosphodiesterase GPCPD1 isoform X2 [Nematostella vectensis]